MNATTSKTPLSTPPPSNPIVQALARWENEGGPLQALPADIDDNGILRHLGAAVIMLWNHFPREIQRDLFDAASEMEEPHADTETARQNMAIFLHHNKNRDASTI